MQAFLRTHCLSALCVTRLISASTFRFGRVHIIPIHATRDRHRYVRQCSAQESRSFFERGTSDTEANGVIPRANYDARLVTVVAIVAIFFFSFATMMVNSSLTTLTSTEVVRWRTALDHDHIHANFANYWAASAMNENTAAFAVGWSTVRLHGITQVTLETIREANGEGRNGTVLVSNPTPLVADTHASFDDVHVSHLSFQGNARA